MKFLADLQQRKQVESGFSGFCYYFSVRPRADSEPQLGFCSRFVLLQIYVLYSMYIYIYTNNYTASGTALPKCVAI